MRLHIVLVGLVEQQYTVAIARNYGHQDLRMAKYQLCHRLHIEGS